MKKEKEPIYNNKNKVFNSPKIIKKNLNPPVNKIMRRHVTFGELQIPKQFRRLGIGNKVFVDEIKNTNKNTNEIIDNPFEKINTFNILN